MKKVSRYITLTTATGQVRTASFQNREHVVVPVVALREGVIKASNSKHHELVPAKVLANFPYGWNGRPVIPNHPHENGVPILANDPKTLEMSQFGTIFNTSSSDKKLLMEAWLDPVRADVVGKDAQSVIRRAKAGEPIEVSIGALVGVEEASGEYEGKHYDGIWTEVAPDHLAMLPEGVRGACNNDMGCGAPRMAEEFSMDEDDKKKSFKERLLALIQFRHGQSKSDMSDSDLRQAISAALRADEPGYLGIDSVFSADKLVVYATMPEDQLKLFRRNYTLKNDGTVKIGDSKEEVEQVVRYEPVGASAAPCGCKGSAEEEAAMKTKAERIKALVENKFNPIKDQKALEVADDKSIEALELHCLTAEEEAKVAAELKAALEKKSADEKAASEQKTADEKATAEKGNRQASEKVVSLQDYISAAPPEVREILNENIRTAKAHKSTIIKALKDTGRCEYTDAQLEAKSVEDLQSMLKLAGGTAAPVDFSGLGLPRAASAVSDGKVAPPPNFHQSVRAASGSK